MVMKNHCNTVYSQQDIWWNPILFETLWFLVYFRSSLIILSYVALHGSQIQGLRSFLYVRGLNCASVRLLRKLGWGQVWAVMMCLPFPLLPVSPLSSSLKPPTKLVSFNNSVVSQEGFWVSTWIVGINELWSGCGRKSVIKWLKDQGRDIVPFLSTWGRRRCYCADTGDGGLSPSWSSREATGFVWLETQLPECWRGGTCILVHTEPCLGSNCWGAWAFDPVFQRIFFPFSSINILLRTFSNA